MLDPHVRLVLEDGTVFTGTGFGAGHAVAGEVVFSTAMTGYPEALTDPAYRGQILVLAYPLVGNYGVAAGPFESERVQVQGLVVADLAARPAHATAARSLESWLAAEGVPGLVGVDTRALVAHLRDHGPLRGVLGPAGARPAAPALELPAGPARRLGAGPLTVLVIDPGMRESAVQALVRRGVAVLRYPAGAPWEEVLAEVDGVVIGSGPGDPAVVGPARHCPPTLPRAPTQAPLVMRVKHLLTLNLPVLGICLGHQLMALAAGGRTLRLPGGHRSLDQPVLDLRTGRAYSTTQNHGYTVDAASLPPDWEAWCVNLQDGSNEGIRHRTRPYLGVQFHPEGSPGPRDTAWIFDEFVARLQAPRRAFGTGQPAARPPEVPCRRVLLLGAGPLEIGQAGEFDYAGTQAAKALRTAGVQVVVLNPNVASVQTMAGVADAVHLLPVTPAYAARVLAEEACDALLLGFGGQTALACGLALAADGTLERLGVRLLGTPVEAIQCAEDRGRFRGLLADLELPAPKGIVARSPAEGREAVRALGLPVVLRAAYALGGQGAAIVQDLTELNAALARAFALAHQVLVEEALVGWKEIELEVVRDRAGNALVACTLEGMDPMGVHTGDSIVVAPAQTLTDWELQALRDAALRLVHALDLVGECNVQFAVDPGGGGFRVIELNPRLSRSSALASKATGYPLAHAAARLALGALLPELVLPDSGRTVFHEPALDHVVVKVPRWDLDRFADAEPGLGPEMRAVGEAMAIGRNFAEALQKALRMTEVGAPGFEPRPGDPSRPTPGRIYALAHALAEGTPPDALAAATGIDPYFVGELARIEAMRRQLAAGPPVGAADERRLLGAAKRLGFSDAQIAATWRLPEAEVRARRWRHGLHPGPAPVDGAGGALSGLASAWYLSYGITPCPGPFPAAPVLVLGSGAYRIGSSLEFDRACVSALQAARELGHPTMVLNANPETVSTDPDVAGLVVFEEPTLEGILELVRVAAPTTVIASAGGQTPNTLAGALAAEGVPIAGTPVGAIATAEDRAAFSALCARLGLAQPAWTALASATPDELTRAVAAVGGFPVLVRPSYVLSGAAMRVAHDPATLAEAARAAFELDRGGAVVASHFEAGARELEVDAVAERGELVLWAICEHVEDAGVHSGDATFLLPPQDVAPEVLAVARRVVAKLAAALDVTGPLNVQLLVREGQVLVLECNLRASRSLPFVSAALEVDFAHAAARAQLGAPPLARGGGRDPLAPGRVAAKAPRFSFLRLRGVDPLPGLVMAATGEAAAIIGGNRQRRIAHDADLALLRALEGAGFILPRRGVLLVPGRSPTWREVAMDFAGAGLAVYAGASDLEGVDLLVCAPEVPARGLRRAAIERGVPLLTDARVACRVARAIALIRGNYPLESPTAGATVVEQ